MMTIGDLITRYKGDRSYDRLATDMGLDAKGNKLLSGKRLGQIVLSGPKEFPEPDTVRGLARALAVPPREIVLSYAFTLGLPVSSDDEDLLDISGLTDGQKEAIRALVIALADAPASAPQIRPVRKVPHTAAAKKSQPPNRGKDVTGDE